MHKIGEYLVPMIILCIVAYGALKKTDVYGAFTRGAVAGLKTVCAIFPTMLALFIAIGAMRSSGLIELISDWARPVTNSIGFPSPLVPFVILRPVSGSGSLAFASDIFSAYGPDSFAGRAVSIMMGSTETTFYTTAVYFAASGTKNIRHTIKCALVADFFSMVVSLIVCRLYYY